MLTELENRGWDQRIRVFRAGDEVDTFAVITQRYVVLVDTMATPELAAEILERVNPLLSTHQLLVVNTHADYDHCWGNVVFVSPGGRHPAPIIAHDKARERLHKRETLQFLEERKRQEARFANVRLVDPTITFSGHLQIDGGDLTLRLIHTPGHTDDHIVVWIPEIKVLLVGDAAEFPFPFVTRADALPTLRKSLHKLISLGASTLMPCHGGTLSPDLPNRNLAYLDAIEDRVRRFSSTQQMPADWFERQDMPAIIGCPYEEALSDVGATADAIPEFYRGVHLRAVRATIANMLASAGDRRAYQAYVEGTEGGSSTLV